MPFPWPRYWRRVAVIFVVTLLLSVALTTFLNEGHLDLSLIIVSLVDSIVLAIVIAFPLTQRIYRGPRR